MSTSRRAMAGLLVAALVPVLVSCASFRGARLYRSGTQALDRGEAGRAIADLERAAGLVPHASEIRNHLGLAYAAAGRRAEAVAAFRLAVELDCDNLAALSNLEAYTVPRGAEGPAQRASEPSGERPASAVR